MTNNRHMKQRTRRLAPLHLAALLLFCTLPAASATGVARAASAADDARPDKPNILLFLVDDMGWQDTSVPFWHKKTPFNERYRTPNMQKLADAGMKFTNAYACCVCSPTRVSLMTGTNAARHRVTDWTLRLSDQQNRNHPSLNLPRWNLGGMSPSADTPRSYHAQALPAILRDAGYRTIHVGKAHFGAIGTPAADPRSIGFDVNIAGHAAGGPASYYGKHNFTVSGRQGRPYKPSHWDIPGLEKYHGEDIHLTEALTREAINAMDDAVEADKPFFLYMAHYAIHTPIMKDDRFIEHYQDLPAVEAAYATMIEGMDKSLGDLMHHVDKLGLTDNTIILFMSDNGGLSAHARAGAKHTHNKPLSSGKGSAREGGVRVPMIAHVPGVTEAGSVEEQYVIIEDFFPTILELAGVDQPADLPQTVDGRSFMPLLRGEAVEGMDQRPLFWHYPNWWGPRGPGIGAHSAVRQGDWKLIYYHADQSYELFNLAEDIGEQHNRAASNVPKRNELARVLRNWLIETDAQMPADKKTGKPIALPDVKPLTNAHAHNDYEHDRPLFDALAQGFCSVEADIHLVDGELLVAHDRDEVRPGRTLRKLYLEPLRQRVQRNGGSVYSEAAPFTLLIDLKSQGEPTYRVLHAQLAEYKDIFTRYAGDRVEPGAVTAIISGNRPIEFMRRQPVRHAGVDGRTSDLGKGEPATLMPLISQHWFKHFTWPGVGEMPPAERAELSRLVKAAHAEGKRIRFWALPHTQPAWAAVEAAGVDLINTDDLPGLARWLSREDGDEATDAP